MQTMTQDSTQNFDGRPGERIWVGLVMCMVCAAGLGCTICALLSSGLEWRILSIAVPAAAANSFIVEIRSRCGNDSMRLSLAHSMLFAGVLALGPLEASLPAAFGAAVRMIGDVPSRRPIHQILYAIAKPAAVCSLASYVYVASGGNVLRPQQVDSFAPLLCAALAYIVANALLAGTGNIFSESSQDSAPRALPIAAGWSLCIFSGYVLAVLYAVAPAYVLLALAAPAVLACIALFSSPMQQFCPKDNKMRQEVDPRRESKTPKAGSAFVDPVTGLANRRYLEMFLRNELSRSERVERPLSVAVFDLDEFKSVPEKDDEAARKALVTMGEKLKSAVRDYDVVASYSSTRLVAVLPEAAAMEAEEIAQRLHSSVTSVQFQKKPLSVSVGISTFPDHGSTAEDLINASHRALNQGRFIGPNRVHSFRELPKAG